MPTPHRLSMMLLFSALPGSLSGQAAPEEPRRVAGVTAGLGNALGWVGAQGEAYFMQDRLSAFAGAGYTPGVEEDWPSGPTFAAGVRGFTSGYKHRGFLELSISQLVLVTGAPNDQRRLYGPGLQAGYHFVSSGGFTLMLSLGLGYAPNVPEGDTEVGGIGGLSLGYTWRR